MLDLASRILILIFLFASMLAIGLKVHFKDISLLLKMKKLLARSLIANFILVPLIGILIAKTIPLPQEVSLAFVVLALTPGGLSAIQFASKIKGEAAYAGFIAFLLSVLAVFISPLLITFFLRFFLSADVSLVIPYWRIFTILFIFLFFPLVLGIFIHHKAESIASKFVSPIAFIGTLAFIAMIVLTLSQRRIAISSQEIEIIGIMLLFIILSMFVGWLMGGPGGETRQILAIVSSIRNVALCLVIVTETMPQAKIITPLVALGALMVPPNLLFTIFVTIRSKKSLHE